MSAIGQALSVMWAAEAREIAMHMDVDAMHAPSECHRDVKRGEKKRLRLARKHAEAVAQMPWRVIKRRAMRQIGPKQLHRAEERAVGQMVGRYAPWA
jgi:hypothetical protein